MIKRLLFLFLLTIAPTFATNAVFISQNGAGTQTGLDCTNPKPFSYFNTAGNWSATPTGIQIGPDTAVHICAGTYTFTLGTNNVLVFQGDGTSGHPVILEADLGAVVIQAPAWGTGSAGQAVITVNGHSFATIDGKTNLTIQATANGTLLANQVNGVSGIRSDGGANVTVQGVTTANIYVHACTLIVNANSAINCTDQIGDSTGGFSGFGNNLLVQNNTFHDSKNGVGLNYSGGGTLSNERVFNNMIYNVDHGFELGITNAGSTVSNVYFGNNTVHDLQNWDISSTLNNFHHDPTHVFSNSGGSVTNVYIYNNIFYGDFGYNFNSSFFSEPVNGATAIFYFNNVSNDQSPFAHLGGCGYFCTEVSNAVFYNNTVIKSNVGTEDAFHMYGNGTGYIGKNNIVIGANMGTHVETGAVVSSWDWNTYYNLGRPDAWGNFNTFTGWQTGTICGGGGCDINGQNGNNPNLNSSYVPNSGSPVITFGVNLNSTCSGQPNPGLGALCFDAANVARPISIKWDDGAYQFASSPTPAPAPSQYIMSAVPLPDPPPQPAIVSVSPTKTYVTSKGCSQNGVKWLNPCTFNLTCSANCFSSTQVALDGIAVTQTYASGVMTVTVPLSVLPIPSQVTVHSFTAVNPTPAVPILAQLSLSPQFIP